MKSNNLLDTATKNNLEELRSDIEELRNENREYRDQVLGRLDDVMGQLEVLREDKELAAYQTRELREDVDDLKRRVTKIEQTQHRS